MRPKLGRRSFFTPEGKVAQMFLKMHTGLSCPKLRCKGIGKSYSTMCELSSRLGINRPRTKFLDVQKANLTYRKQRKHSRSQTRKITRRLLDIETCSQCGVLVGGGNCILAMKNGQKYPAVTTGNRYEIEILMSRTQKLKGLSAASLRLKTLNDNPKISIISRGVKKWIEK